MATQTHACLRWMIRRDIASVLDIEHNSFEFPWTDGEFIQCLRKRTCIGMVAEVNEEVVGYMLYETGKKEIELISFAVHPKHRQSGIGGALVSLLIGKLAAGRRSKIVVAVRDSNLQAQLFFRSMGFFCTKMVKDYYSESDDNAYIMEYWIGD